MNIFFGKISPKFDTVQLEEGYYSAPKGSTWFGELEIGDYVYMIGGDKVQFWQAKKWGDKNGRESLFFDVLNSNLGINVSQLIALKFLKITKGLAVMTSRSARNKAFFKLEMIKDVSLTNLSNTLFYNNPELYRTIKIIQQEDIIEKSEDIQLIYKDNKLQLVDADFIENAIKTDFIDNLNKKGKGAKMKDNVLEFFSNAINNLPTTITYKEIGLRSFYDTFFCEYIGKDKYFLVGAFWDTSNPQDQTERFVKEGIWFNGYEDKFLEEVNAVPIGSNIAIKAAFVREKTKSVMTIKARGVVTENLLDGQTLKVDWEDDFVPFEVNFGGYRRTIKEVIKSEHIKSIWSPESMDEDITSTDKNSQTKENDMRIFPLNQILYGPPGTGKTYKLVNEYFNYFRITNKTINKEEYEAEIISKLNWWQIIALVLLDGKSKVPDINKHRYIKYKLQVSNTKSLNQTVWGQLSCHTILESKTVNYTRRVDPLFFDKSTDSTWEIITEKKELIDDLIEIATKISEYKENTVTANNCKFITFHQSFSYEDFIEGIKPVMNDESSEENSNVNYTIEKGIFYNCCNEAAKVAGFLSLKDAIENHSQSERVERFKDAKPYGIFIDEINRGNISQIFGELITLIEDDKRLGESEIILELPYSKDKFGVPPNLYIVGTMNTADRSVEALDTALRRRFCFEEMSPKSKVVAEKGFSDYSRVAIMEKINNRIELLLDRNHTLGHAYFIKENFKSSFENEIIPLLQEYFYNDYGKIGLVLGKGFVREKAITAKSDKSIFADFDTKNEVDILKSYELIPFNDIDFDTAIATLQA